MTCSECGRTQSKEKRFFRTRRRWRGVTVGAALLVIAVGTTLGPAMTTGAWVRNTPTGVLRLVLGFFRKDAADVTSKFEKQPSVSKLTQWERVLLASEFGRALKQGAKVDAAALRLQSMALFFLDSLGEDARAALPELAASLNDDGLAPFVAQVHIKLGRRARRNAPALISALRRSPEPLSQRSLIIAIFAVGGHDQQTAGRLRKEVEASASDPDRLDAIAAWMMLDAEDPAIVDALANVLSNGQARYRIIAVRLLGILAHSREGSHVPLEDKMEFAEFMFSVDRPGFPTPTPVVNAIPIIKRALDDTDPEVRRHAQDVLTGFERE